MNRFLALLVHKGIDPVSVCWWTVHEDIPIWESRLEWFQRKRQWSKALMEIDKLMHKYSKKISRLKKTIDERPEYDHVYRGFRYRLNEMRLLEEEIKRKID